MCDLCFKKKNKVMNIDKRNLNRKNLKRKNPIRKNPIRKNPIRKNPNRKKLNKDIVRKNSKNKKMKVLKIYPNNWHYMIKINRKNRRYWWWNKTTNEVSFNRPKNFDFELKTVETCENNDFKQEIITDYQRWKYMETSHPNSEAINWWWNPITDEAQFEVPKNINELVV
tara:strand:- start:388 stop:894 length:507 start_codon:yes stop_codon:yes gene_type:complete